MNLDCARKMLGVAAFAGASFLAAPAYATITIFGDIAGSTEQTGSNFSADVTYTPTSTTAATLTVDLTNSTSPASVGGFLTAFVMNNPGDAIDTISLSSSLATMIAMSTVLHSDSSTSALVWAVTTTAGSKAEAVPMAGSRLGIARPSCLR
jgi:hypothetical protein